MFCLPLASLHLRCRIDRPHQPLTSLSNPRPAASHTQHSPIYPPTHGTVVAVVGLLSAQCLLIPPHQLSQPASLSLTRLSSVAVAGDRGWSHVAVPETCTRIVRKRSTYTCRLLSLQL